MRGKLIGDAWAGEEPDVRAAEAQQSADEAADASGAGDDDAVGHAKAVGPA